MHLRKSRGIKFWQRIDAQCAHAAKILQSFTPQDYLYLCYYFAHVLHEKCICLLSIWCI